MSFLRFLNKLFKPTEVQAPALPVAASQPREVVPPATPSPTAAGMSSQIATYHYDVYDQAFAEAFSKWRKGEVMLVARLQALSVKAATEYLENRSGYVREFSLRVLMAHDGVAALRPVLRRLNDYVAVNRALSLQLVLHWLAQMPVADLLEALPDLYALEKQSRVDSKQVLSALQARLADPQNRELVLAGVGHTSARVRIHCWRLCLTIFDWSNQEKVERALASGDTGLARTVEPLVLEMADDELQALFVQRQRLKAMPLRRAVYLGLWRRQLGNLDALLHLALWDRSYSIRWLARNWSKDQPQVLVDAYRCMLAAQGSVRLKRYALEGLGQLGQPDTLDCCEAALQDASPTLQRAGLEALCNFASAARYAYLIRALEDGDVVMVRRCFQLSHKTGDYFAYDDLLPIAHRRGQEIKFFVSLLAYADQMSPWLGIHLASLTRFAAADVQVALKPRVDDFLDVWARGSNYFPASQKQWADVSAWLPYETYDPRSLLRFALEGEAKRVKVKG